jgi:aclacinomycin oxidase
MAAGGEQQHQRNDHSLHTLDCPARLRLWQCVRVANIDSRISSDDPRYRALLDKQFNKRFRAQPDYVCIARSTQDVIDAEQTAVDESRRIVVTSGGHCLEGFVSDPDARVILDVSPMKRISHDDAMQAVCVEAGATVGETFRALFEQWGTLIPLGEHPDIGIGGHVAGGAFGFLCREFGLAADYLYAIEVVIVDEHGRAQIVIATREESDPNRELWWAHTGGGAGNFGVATRLWFRDLPRAPQSITTFKVQWNWSDVDERAFLQLLQRHGTWCGENSAADSPNASLWTLMQLHRKQLGVLITRGLSTAGGAAAREQIDDYLAALGAPKVAEAATMSWLEFALNPFPDLFAAPPGGVAMKAKDALLKKRLNDRQIGVVHDYLTREDYDVMGALYGLATYGGRINTVSSDATASAQRDCILDTACNVGWIDPAEAEKNLRWAREFYRELFAETGGVPVPNDANGGSFINHPDPDLADPSLNTSGVPWHTLYYQDNYPRLQRVKARWDPRNVFHHALSVRP